MRVSVSQTIFLVFYLMIAVANGGTYSKSWSSFAYHDAMKIAEGNVAEQSTVNYMDIPWNVLNEWLSQMNGNPHVSYHQLLVERGITRQKVLDELERRFQNEEDTDVEEDDERDLSEYSVQEVDQLAKTNPKKFIELKDREMVKFKYQGQHKYKKESEYRIRREKSNSVEHDSNEERNDYRLEETTLMDDMELMRQAFERVQVMGYGRDWKVYRNAQGYTHFEELLIYQPRGWKTFAREYIFKYEGNIHWSIDHTPVEEHTSIAFFKQHSNISFASPETGISTDDLVASRTVQVKIDGHSQHVDIMMRDPVSVVLFHPELSRHSRYQPLNFLLAYGCKNPLPKLFADIRKLIKDENVCELILAEMSPLDYFFDFQRSVKSYKLEMLRQIGAKTQFPRLAYIKELDFCDIVGQRTAKEIVRSEVVRFIWDRITESKQTSGKQPLSMIFAGPSGVGKTELAVALAKLMNRPGPEGKPGSEHFLKVDCGKMTDAGELFGLSGAYQGATQGSTLNNFILRKSREKGSLGIVLLDEIEKADQGVIHALYQVLDKGEWTNKRLDEGSVDQTQVIPCGNIIFILTTNAATDLIQDFSAGTKLLYTAQDPKETEEKQRELEALLRYKLQGAYPFTDAFIARIDKIVPFLPMARGVDSKDHPLMQEAMAVSKMLIEDEQEKLQVDQDILVKQSVSARNKHSMAKLVVMESIEEAGARSLQKNVASKMGHQIKHALLVEDGGIETGSKVRYSADEDTMSVDWRLEAMGVSRDSRLAAEIESSESDSDTKKRKNCALEEDT